MHVPNIQKFLLHLWQRFFQSSEYVNRVRLIIHVWLRIVILRFNLNDVASLCFPSNRLSSLLITITANMDFIADLISDNATFTSIEKSMVSAEDVDSSESEDMVALLVVLVQTFELQQSIFEKSNKDKELDLL